MGGEKMEIMLDVWTYQGSPPRRRGKDKAEHLVQDHIGITPAQAGKRVEHEDTRGGSEDHPRVGGEKTEMRFSL